MKVGFIGLGRMGSGMARRVLGAGHELTVYDVSRAQAEAIGSAGAGVAESVAHACEGRDVVITMLVEDATVVDVTVRPKGLRDSMPRGAIHLAMGTYGVAAIRTLGAAHGGAGQVLVAAPVLGRPDLAASGQLGVVAAGPDEDVRRCLPLLEAIGKRIFMAGPQPECATAIKLANNAVLGCAMVAMAEGFAFVAMARALLREPDLVNRMTAQQADHGICIHCNRCMPTIYSGTRCPVREDAGA